MGKYNDVFVDTKEIFDEVIVDAKLDQYVNTLVLSDNKQKEIGKVSKASPILKYKTDDDVVVIINEAVFELLDSPLKKMTAEMIMAGVSFNSEKDKIEITKPDFTIHTGLLKKYGGDACINLNTLIRDCFAQKAEEDAKEDGA